ncbi:MAG: ACT domain-containing protein [Actinobacteria bacterium]|nr:ACT domain-containing protein [Actinomycetota bacterium]
MGSALRDDRPARRAPDPAGVTAAPGPEWCRAWGARLDDALRSWLATDARAGRLALVALGSYARTEVCPRSDIDLLVLHDGWSDQDLEHIVRSLCYPLWDAGRAVGYAVHTPRSAVRAAGDRIDTATALMDRRLLWGESGLLDQLASAYRRWLRRRSGKVLGELADADAQRHRRAGAEPGMLEPELKSGAGGLRDLHSLRWAAGIVLGELGLRPLVGARYLGATDHRALVRANADLLTIRCALHLCAASATATDVLRLDLQDEIAALISAAGSDEVLARANLAMRTIAHVHGRSWPLLLADARSGRRRDRHRPVVLDDGIHLVNGLVETDDRASLADDPTLGMRTVAAAAREGSHLGRATVTRLQRDLARIGHLPWNQRTRSAFLTALRRGPDALPALADADHVGLLEAHLPEWRRVRGRPQRNPYHRYDLDTHLFQTVAWLRRIADGELGDRLVAIHERLDEPDVLLLGALFHDVGKAWDGDHSIVGAQVVGRWVAHMGFDQRRSQRAARLVRLHLLLPDVAQHRDLDDRGEVREVADRVVDTETLDALLLLSLADARATGPSAYSPWKDGLLIELHARARRALTGGEGGGPIVAPETKVATLRDRPGDVPPDALDRLLHDVPSRYLLVADIDQIAEHARLLASLGRGGRTAVAGVREQQTAATVTITLVAWDRRGLLADVVGALAGLGLDVLEARAFTRDDTVVLDWFVVRRRPTATAPSVDPLVAQVEAAGRGMADVERSVSRQERRWDERPRSDAQLITPAVAIDRSVGTARIEVEGRDVPGVLFRLLRVLATAGLDVAAARVATLGPQVRDVFFVTAPDDVDWDDLTAQLYAVVSPEPA